MLARLIVMAAISAALTLAAPAGYSLHFPDSNPQNKARVLAADRSGNLFIVSSSPQTSTIVNIHVIKTDPAGNLIGTFDFGGSGVDTPTAAAVDPLGNLVIVGATQSADFPLSYAVLNTGTAFATKIDSQLRQILFSTRLGTAGGGAFAGASAVAIDAAGNIYVTGSTSAGFPTTSGVLQPVAPTLGQNGTISHGFVSELSAAGDRIIFATYFSGGQFICANAGQSPCLIFQPRANLSPPVIWTTPSSIAVDPAGNVIIAGTTNSSGIPVSDGAYATQCSCTNLNGVAFIASIGAAGTKLRWGTYIPVAGITVYAPSIVGVPLNTIASIAIDAPGNVIFAGLTVTPTPGTPGVDLIKSAVYGGYVGKLDTSGSKLLFSAPFGGAPSALVSAGPAAVSIDPAGAIWLTGSAAPGTLPAPAGTPLLGENYIAALSPDGTAVLSLVTVPDGGSGQAIQTTPAGIVATLGNSGALLLSSPTQAPSLLGIAGSFSWTAANSVAPRSLLSLYGLNIGPATAQTASISNGMIASSLGGVQVLFDGVPAALLYAGPTQINAIVPSLVAGRRSTTISINTPSGTIAGPSVPVVNTLPQVSSVNIFGLANALNQDGTVNTGLNPAPRGSIVTIWATGGGAQSFTPDRSINSSLQGNPYPISVLSRSAQPSFGYTSLEVLYAGDAPDQPSGVIQVNFRLPVSQFSTAYSLQIGDADAQFFVYVR